MVSINDLVSGTIHRIDNIPSSITGSPMIYEFIDDARKDIQNITGDTIDANNVPEKYQTILKNLGAAYTLSRMTGIGVDFDYSLGTFRVIKGRRDDPNTKQMEFFLNQVNLSLKYVGTRIPFRATFL